jgi:hypothetical protein
MQYRLNVSLYVSLTVARSGPIARRDRSLEVDAPDRRNPLKSMHQTVFGPDAMTNGRAPDVPDDAVELDGAQPSVALDHTRKRYALGNFLLGCFAAPHLELIDHSPTRLLIFHLLEIIACSREWPG